MRKKPKKQEQRGAKKKKKKKKNHLVSGLAIKKRWFTPCCDEGIAETRP
jgi:hypothetical protein